MTLSSVWKCICKGVFQFETTVPWKIAFEEKRKLCIIHIALSSNTLRLLFNEFSSVDNGVKYKAIFNFVQLKTMLRVIGTLKCFSFLN